MGPAAAAAAAAPAAAAAAPAAAVSDDINLMRCRHQKSLGAQD
jgi:hypothetical protein